ncbi:MAG: hypothetical protein V1779_12780 [bacterium]
MKNYKSLILATLTLVLMLGISSCNKSDGPTDGSWSMYDSPVWQIPEPDNSAADIVEGTLDMPFDLVAQNEDVRFCDNTGMYNTKMFQERRKFMPLAKILRALQLDDLQKEQVKGFMLDFRLCHREAMLALRESEKELLAPFNEQRRLIYEAYKSGEITREEAARQLKLLAQEVRQVMKDNPARIEACEAMKECRRLLLANIGGVLTEEQLVKWNEWLSRLPEIDCTREE